MTGSKETGQSNNQKTIVQESRTTNNEPGSAKTDSDSTLWNKVDSDSTISRLRDAKTDSETETKNKKSDLDQSYEVRDTKLAKLTPETSIQARTEQGGNGANNAVVTKMKPDHRT